MYGGKLLQERQSFKREQVYSHLYDHSTNPIFFLDLEGRVLDRNLAAERMLDVAVGVSLYEALDEEGAATVSWCLGRAGRGETSSREIEVDPGDGKPVQVRAWSTPVTDEGEVVAASVVLADNAERKSGEEERALLASIVETTDDAILTNDLNGLITTCNRGAEELYGYSRDKVVGQPVSMLMPEDRRHEVDEVMREIREGRSVRSRETTHQNREGRLFPVSITVSPIHDGSGELVSICTVSHDISDIVKAAEEARLAVEQLEARNQELQDFAYVASHDLQEPLRKIQSFGGRLRDRAGDALEGRSADYLQRMMDASSRMQELINDLLDYSRVTSKANPAEPVDLSSLVAGTVSDLESRVEETGGEVKLGELPQIRAEAVQMRQLFQNLIGNGLKFHREGVSAVVSVEARLLEDEEMSGGGMPGREVYEFRVTDNGIGFEEKYLDRIFTPFQRLHGRGEYEGTGIGLAVCRKIVERHGGWITAQSTPGEGTTFVFTLPAQQDEEPELKDDGTEDDNTGEDS